MIGRVRGARLQPEALDQRGRRLVRLPALGAQPAHQPLRQHAAQHRGQQVVLDAHVAQPGDAAAAELVCRVDSTRWPVSAACTAICAVSRSRISPTMITSGSWRRIERSREAKVRPICGLVWIWLMPRSWYSIGSSTVTTLRVDRVQAEQPGVERGGLARAGRAGDQHDAVRQLQALSQPGHDGRRQPELAIVEHYRRTVEHAQHHGLAVQRGDGGDTKVNFLRATAIDRRTDRIARIERNAGALGVPGLALATGPAPQALAGLAPPDAIFIGGGAGDPELVEAAWAALPAGGRLVINAVTLETASALAGLQIARGGELTTLAVTHAVPVGRYRGWRPAMPVTQWAASKP